MYVVEGNIHESLSTPDEDNPQFDRYLVTDSGDYYAVDCWLIDRSQNVHPSYNVCPIPVLTEDLGPVVDSTYY